MATGNGNILLFDKNGKQGMADGSGKQFIPITYDHLRPFIVGYASFRLNGKAGYIRQSDLHITKTDHLSIGHFRNGIATAGNRDGWGVIDTNAQIIVPFKYKRLRGFFGGLATTSENGQSWKFIREDGSSAFPGDYFNPSLSSTGLIGVRWTPDGKFGFLDRAGRTVIPARYESIGHFSEGLCAVITGNPNNQINPGYHGFIDAFGVVKIRFPKTGPFFDMHRDELIDHSFHDGLVRLNGNYYDQTGKQVWEARETTFEQHENARAEKAVFSTNVVFQLHGLIHLQRDDEAIRLLAKNRHQIGSRPSDDYYADITLIEKAVRRGSPRMIEYLIDKGASLDMECSGHRSILETAIKERISHRLEAVRLLLNRGADPNLHFKGTDNVISDLPTALGLACRNQHSGDVEIARLLLDVDAEPNGSDASGFTPLHEVFGYFGNMDTGILELLLSRGANPNAENEDGETPIFGLDPKETPEVWPEVVQLLHAHGSDMNHKSHDGDTPLHLIVQRSPNIRLIEALLQHGANVSAKNNEGNTPLDTAKSVLHRLRDRETEESERFNHAKKIVELLESSRLPQ